VRVRVMELSAQGSLEAKVAQAEPDALL